MVNKRIAQVLMIFFSIHSLDELILIIRTEQDTTTTTTTTNNNNNWLTHAQEEQTEAGKWPWPKTWSRKSR